MKKLQKGFVIPLSILFIAILMALGLFVFVESNKPTVITTPNQPTACTEESMQCPDGSFVGRTGPDCEFVCPVTNLATSTNSTSTNPIISSISPTSGPIGTLVTVLGKNLSGFEGDKNLWIENSSGQKGIILTGGSRLVNTDSSIKFTLGVNYCTTDTSYSGLPCPSLINITPGIYNIYASPWGKVSNKVQFTVTSN